MPESVAASSVSSRTAAAGIELSGDAAFAGRVTRLGFTSIVALGVIYALARFTTESSTSVNASLAAGWVLMPTVLFASLKRPSLRYLLVIPATLVTLPLVAITRMEIGSTFLQALGWLLITIGVMLGGLLGMWFWYRWLPVPQQFSHPFSRGRLMLIRVHVILITAGMLVVAANAM